MGGLGGLETGVARSMSNAALGPPSSPAKREASAAEDQHSRSPNKTPASYKSSPAKPRVSTAEGAHAQPQQTGLGAKKRVPEEDQERRHPLQVPAQAMRRDAELARKMQIEEEAPRFDSIIKSVVADLQPTPNCHHRQTRLIQRLERILKDIYGPKVQLEVFGSTVCNLAGKSSDLDMTFSPGLQHRLNLSDKKQVLRKLAKVLQISGMRAVPILGARVPIIKLKDHNETRLAVDLSVENELPVFKSRLLHEYSLIDKRFSQLVLVVKAWAKARAINSAAQGTFNSFGLSLLVVHYLQVSCLSTLRLL
jgi:DNA polymerase sigma